MASSSSSSPIADDVTPRVSMSASSPDGSKSVSIEAGVLQTDTKCVSCGAMSRLGTMFGAGPPEFFCSACTIDGKLRERYRGVDAASGGSPNVIKGVCSECHKSLPVKLCIQAGTENFIFCTECTNAGKAHIGTTPQCVICRNPAKPQFTHRVTFIKLANQPTFGKACCSERCYSAVMQYSHKTQGDNLQIKCNFCQKLLGKDPLRCARCKAVYYCNNGKACQTADWKCHKKACCQVGEIPNVVVTGDDEIRRRMAEAKITVGASTS